MSKTKRCKIHKIKMLYFYGWLCPACFPFWGQAPVTVFDVALKREMKRDD